MAFISLTVSSTLGLTAFRLLSRVLISHQLLQQRVLVLGTDLADVIIRHSVSRYTTLRAMAKIKDLARFPELVLLNKLSLAPAIILGVVVYHPEIVPRMFDDFDNFA